MGDVVEVDLVVVGGEVSAADPVVYALSGGRGDVCGLGLCDKYVLGAQYFAFTVG